MQPDPAKHLEGVAVEQGGVEHHEAGPSLDRAAQTDAQVAPGLEPEPAFDEHLCQTAQLDIVGEQQDFARFERHRTQRGLRRS